MRIFRKTNQLIGPELYPLYTLVVKIVAIVALAGTLIGNTLDFTFNGQSLLHSLGTTLALGVSSLVAGFGWVTLVFAVLERTVKPEDLEKLKEDLEKEAPSKKKPGIRTFGRPGVITGIFFTLAFLILVNHYAQFLGIYYNLDAGGVFLPLLDERGFAAYLPWINGMLMLQLAFSAMKLVFRKWNFTMAGANLLLNILSLILVWIILGDAGILHPDFLEGLRKLGEESGGAIPALGTMIRFLKSIFLLILVFDSGEGFYNAWRNHRLIRRIDHE